MSGSVTICYHFLKSVTKFLYFEKICYQHSFKKYLKNSFGQKSAKSYHLLPFWKSIFLCSIFFAKNFMQTNIFVIFKIVTIMLSSEFWHILIKKYFAILKFGQKKNVQNRKLKKSFEKNVPLF